MRFGLIGCGAVGSLRAAALAASPSLRLVAVSDLDPTRAAAVARRAGAAVVADWAALVRRDDVDAVVVSSPPPAHLDMCVAALRAGKHVLCEKPLARTPDECREMLAEADRAQRVLATGFNYRFYPAIKQARALLDAGVIGELDHVRSYAGHPGGAEFTHPWVHDAAVMGGGTLMDNGIHLIDLTRSFLGGVAEVTGTASGDVWKFPGCEDNGFALLRSPTGRTAVLQSSWSEWRGYRFSIEIAGTRGCIRASYPPMLTTLWHLDGRERRRRRIYAFPAFQVVERLRSFRWTAQQSFVEEFREFVNAVHGRPAANALGWDGYMAVLIAHSVYRSSAHGGTVTLPEAAPAGAERRRAS